MSALPQYKRLADGITDYTLRVMAIVDTNKSKANITASYLTPILGFEGWEEQWLSKDKPIVILVTADGIVDHAIKGDLEDIYNDVKVILPQWLDGFRSTQLKTRLPTRIN